MNSTPPKPMTIPEFRTARTRGVKLAVVTAYDFTSAKIAEAAGVDCILIGDSLGMVVQGHATSIPVTMGQIVYHTRCVARGSQRSLIIADMPFNSYQSSPSQAVRNAGRLIQAGAHAVKLEGGSRMLPAIEAIVRADIPVMGHVGLTPQSVHRMGGFKVQRDRELILADAKAVEAAGVFSMVVEGVPSSLGAEITQAVNVPTIGIGAGKSCDGQVLVWHDLLGLFDSFKPKFVKQYANLGELTRQAISNYCKEVRDGSFPDDAHSFQ